MTRVSELASKIANGREVTEADLTSVASLHGNREDLVREIPHLNRAYLHGWDTLLQTQGSVAANRKIVRQVGMVQDMLEPEYYVQEYHGQSTHFRDLSSFAAAADENEEEKKDPQWNAPSMSHSHQLAERVPLVVVPVPFTSEWYQTQINPPTSEELTAAMEPQTTSVLIPESPPGDAKSSSPSQSSRKRQRDLNNEVSTDTVDTTKRNHSGDAKSGTQQTNMDCDSALETPEKPHLYGQESDWWPQGQFDSSSDECPVLAKFYYDQYPKEQQQQRLKLNDMIEMIGVISMDPWEASFENSEQDDPFMDFQEPLPPPSRLPRLHVLSFRRLDLDEPKFRSTDAPQESTSISESNDNLKDWTHYCGELADPTLVKLLGLALLGKAERAKEPRGEDAAMVRAPSHALGCASLQLCCDSNQSSRRAYEQLLPFLRSICPVVAGIDGSLGSGPSKTTGRLLPTPWQLPRGSTLLIHIGDRPIATNVREILQELVEQHRIAYSFEGGMRVPFEADYRVILISAPSKSRRALPSALTYAVANVDDLDLPNNVATLNLLQKWMAHRRAAIHNVRLPQDLLEQAQKDFLERRKHAREASSMAPSTTTTSEQAMPEEGDFHRWLTLTRLLARASQHSSATLADWEHALIIDDSLTL